MPRTAQPQAPLTRPIDEIIVGKRHRRDMGDIAGLAASIAGLKNTLLHPIVIRPDGTLIAGERRLRAAQLLGWKDIPVTVVDLDQIVRGEWAENAFQKPFTLSEAVAIKRELEPIEREAAQKRMRAGKPLENFSEGNGRALDKIAKAARLSRITLAKAEAVVDAAEAEPEKFGKLKEDMDRTNRANGAYRRLKIAKQAEQIRAEPSPLPGNGPYRVATIDLPWRYENRDDDPSHRAAGSYPTMSLAEMCALPVPSIMHADAILWMWVTNHHMREAFAVLDAWGFTQKTILTWAKLHRQGTGDWLIGQTEHCLMAVRGKPIVTLTKQTTLLHAARRAHSQKPVEFYELVESLCPAPRYADLFSRYKHNDKWDCHGDEAPPPDAPPAREEAPADDGPDSPPPAADSDNPLDDIPSFLLRGAQ